MRSLQEKLRAARGKEKDALTKKLRKAKTALKTRERGCLALLSVQSIPTPTPTVFPRPTATSSPKEQISKLEDQGSIPKLDRSSDIAGPDANANTIRDDVESFITTNYTLVPQQTAAQQFARVMQEALLVDKSNKVAVKAIAVKSSRAINCIYARFNGTSGTSTPPATVIEQVKSISTNTKPRLLAYLAYAKALNGTVGALPEGDTCE